MTIVKVIPMPGIPGPQGPQGPQGPAGSGGNIADFVFTGPSEETNDSAMTISNHDMVIRTTRDDDQDADIDIRSADDVWIRAEGDEIGISAFSTVEVSTNDGNNTWVFGNGGGLDLPGGGNIYNPPNSAGDGSGLPTLQLSPATYTGTDQYIILDPTAPNHIHIRAGGNIDDSSAELILGGERNHVSVSDMSRSVRIQTGVQENANSYLNENLVNNENFITTGPAVIDIGYKVFVDGTEYTVTSVQSDAPVPGMITATAPGATFISGQTYTFTGDNGNNNYWYFGNDGYFYGPDEGNLKIQGIYGGASGTFVSQDNKTITVSNGIITSIEVNI